MSAGSSTFLGLKHRLRSWKTSRPQDDQHGESGNVAIERVLKTEHDGVAALASSASEARRLLEESRVLAGDIARRADARISKLHAAYLQKVDQDLQRLADENPAASDNTNNVYQPEALAEAVRRVAIKLTGDP